MKNRFAILLCMTLIWAQAQEKVSAVITDNSNSLKYLSGYAGQSQLIEIYPNNDVLVYDWTGTDVGPAKFVRNIPGIGSFKNIHIGERALLYESNNKNYYYDFTANTEPAALNIPSLDLAAGRLPLPGFGSSILGGNKPYHLFTAQSSSLIPLPVEYNIVQNHEQFVITSKAAANGMGSNYACYNALSGEFTPLIEGASRKHSVCFYNGLVWFLNTRGEVMVMDLKSKTIQATGIATDLKVGNNALFTDGRTLLICQSNVEKTYLEAYDLISNVRLWEYALNLEGGVEKNQIGLYQNHVLLRTSRDKMVTLDVSDQFFTRDFDINASFSPSGMPIIGAYLIVPFQNEFTIFDLRQKKIHKQKTGFGLYNLQGIMGTEQNFEVTFSCDFVDKKLPTLFSFSNDSLAIKNILAYNTGCATDAHLHATETNLFLVDHSLFTIRDQEQRITTTSFRQGKNRYINFAQNTNFYTHHSFPFFYLLAHDGTGEDTLYTASESTPDAYKYVTKINGEYFVFAGGNLAVLNPSNNGLEVKKNNVSGVIESDHHVFFKTGNKLGVLDTLGTIREYDVNPVLINKNSLLHHNGITLYLDQDQGLAFLKDGVVRVITNDVFIVNRLIPAGDYIFVSYLSSTDFQEKWLTVDAMGKVTELDQAATNQFTVYARQCKDFLILQTDGLTHYIYDFEKNSIVQLPDGMQNARCLYLYQNGKDTLAYMLEDNTLSTYKLSQSFTQYTLTHSLPFDDATDRLHFQEVPNHLVLLGTPEMLVFDPSGKVTYLPLNTSLLENNPLVEWQGHYYCIAGDAEAVRQVYRIDFNELSTAVADVSKSDKVMIFPNPASRILNLSGWEKAQSLEVLNSGGSLVFKTSANPEIRIEHLPNDMYYLKVVQSNGEIIVLPFIKID